MAEIDEFTDEMEAVFNNFRNRSTGLPYREWNRQSILAVARVALERAAEVADECAKDGQSPWNTATAIRLLIPPAKETT